MKQGIQNDFTFNKRILKYGCYFLCLIELGDRLNYDQLKDRLDDPRTLYDTDHSYQFYVKQGAMKSDCTILDPAFILGDITGKEYRFTRPNEKPDYPYYIIENIKPGYTHFTLRYKDEIWDPLPPNRAAAKHYTPRSYRLLTPLS
ncbi:MAG: DUF261 domain-containing protein [Treponema sp.]|jgi:hypothetical protein|nr:DUF261 domain-containing protein [Treponema sp.]